MTYFLQDIVRQPRELRRTIEHLCGAGEGELRAAVKAVQNASNVYLTGIGSSWHAAQAAAPLFQMAGFPVVVQDASELLQFTTFPPASAVIAISRSGRSTEILSLLAKARGSSTTVIAITNSPEGPLAREAPISIVIPIELDHAVSVNTYSTLAAAAAIVARSVVGSFDSDLSASLLVSLAETAQRIPDWQAQIVENQWFAPAEATYFLARGSSLGSCHEARLLWEEAAKSPASAMGTGSFRHGPQEIVNGGIRFGLWMDGLRLRDQDFSVASDLRSLGASLMLIGQDLPGDTAGLVFQLPRIAADWQFLIDIIPAQLVAEAMARRTGVDCDSFRICSYIVEGEYGLREKVASCISQSAREAGRGTAEVNRRNGSTAEGDAVVIRHDNLEAR